MSKNNNLLHQTVKNVISWLVSEKINGGAKVPADRDFARKLGVSPMTLANALKVLESEGIVRRVARQGTYLVNPLKTPPVIDVYCPSQWRDILMKNDYTHHSYMLYRQYIDGIMNAGADNGLSLSMEYVSQSSYVEDLAPRRSVNRAGVIYLGYRHRGELERLIHAKTPYVRISDIKDENNEIGRSPTAIYDGLTHLYQLGHRRFGIITGYTGKHTLSLANRAFYSWLEERGIIYDESNEFLLNSIEPETVLRELKKQLSRDNLPTAFFSCSPPFTRSFLEIMTERGIKVPDEISLLSFGAREAFFDLNIDISSADPMFYKQSYEAVRKLLECIANNTYSFPSFEIQTYFHVGQTCGVCKN